MRAARVVLSRSCNQACAFCEVADVLDGAPLPAASLRAAIERARAAGAEEIVFTGGEPTLSGHFLKAVSYARGLGLRTSITTHGRLLGDPARLGRVVAAGLDAVTVSLHALDPAVHAALTGVADPLALPQALSGLRAAAGAFRVTLRTVLTRANVGELPALVALAAEVGATFDLRGVRPRGRARDAAGLALSTAEALDAWKAVWTDAHRRGVPFTWGDLDATGLLDAPAPTLPAPLDALRRAQLVADLVDRDLLGGLATPDDDGLAWLAAWLRVPLAEVGHVAAARRIPLVALPPALGGAGPVDGPGPAALGPARPLPAWRGARSVAVVVDASADAVAARSTLPGLHHALRALGVDSTLHSLFRAPTDPATIPALPTPRALGKLAGLLRAPDERPLHPDEADVDLLAAEARWLERLDLGAPDVVVVGSARAAARLRPRLPASTRLVALDADLLAGLDGDLGDDDVLRSPFPAAARAYVLAGLSLRTLHWRPLPFHLPHLPASAPEASRTVVLAGGDAVDPDLVRRAWPDDAGLRLLRLDTDADVGDAIPTDPAARLRAVATARLVWLPVRPSLAPAVARAASLALAAGRPLVATETPLTADHARPADARLLPPDADAHRALLRRLAADDAAVRALAPTAARRARASTAELAAELHQGAPPVRVHPAFPGAGPWGSW